MAAQPPWKLPGSLSGLPTRRQWLTALIVKAHSPVVATRKDSNLRPPVCSLSQPIAMNHDCWELRESAKAYIKFHNFISSRSPRFDHEIANNLPFLDLHRSRPAAPGNDQCLY